MSFTNFENQMLMDAQRESRLGRSSSCSGESRCARPSDGEPVDEILVSTEMASVAPVGCYSRALQRISYLLCNKLMSCVLSGRAKRL
jgi:hypothetical protein